METTQLISRLEAMYYSYCTPRVAPSLGHYTLCYLGELERYRHENRDELHQNNHYPQFCLATLSISSLYGWARKNEEKRPTEPSLQSLYDLLSSLIEWKEEYDVEGAVAKEETIKIHRAIHSSLIYCHEDERSLNEVYHTPVLRFLRLFVHNEIVVKNNDLAILWSQKNRFSACNLLSSLITHPEKINDARIHEMVLFEIPTSCQSAYNTLGRLFDHPPMKWGVTIDA